MGGRKGKEKPLQRPGRREVGSVAVTGTIPRGTKKCFCPGRNRGGKLGFLEEKSLAGNHASAVHREGGSKSETES